MATAANGEYFDTTDPSTGEKLASCPKIGGRRRCRGETARAALLQWQALTPHASRARYLYALARQVQKHSRWLAVLETLGNGKPIRESRDIDIPLVARHFYHHAGWAQLLEQEFPGYTACGVVGQIIPWNFPLLMLAWKIAARARHGQYGRVETRGIYVSHRARVRTNLPGSRSSARSRQYITGDGSTGEALVKHPEVDKMRSRVRPK